MRMARGLLPLPPSPDGAIVDAGARLRCAATLTGLCYETPDGHLNG